MLVVEILDRRAVRHDIPFKSEIFSQTISQPVLTARDRYAVKVVVRTHDAKQARFFDRRRERRHENVLDLPRRSLRIGARLYLARAFRRAVNNVMFRGRGDGVVLL